MKSTLKKEDFQIGRLFRMEMAYQGLEKDEIVRLVDAHEIENADRLTRDNLQGQLVKVEPLIEKSHDYEDLRMFWWRLKPFS